MTFCGQCGLQVAPGATRCPRCGAVMESNGQQNYPTVSPNEYQPNAPTTQSPSLLARSRQQDMQSPRGSSGEQDQQKLVLPSYPDTPYYPQDSQSPYSSATEQAPALNISQRTSYPSYPGYMPPQGPSHAGYPSHVSGYQQPLTQYQEYQAARDRSARNARGRATGLIFILLGLLLILGATILFMLQRHGVNVGGSGSSSAATGVPITQRAHALIQHYYDDINSHDYADAYSLWKPGTLNQSYSAFCNGFKDTLYSKVTFQNIAEQENGTINVAIGLDASITQAANRGTQYTSYQGYYIVEPQANGTLFITRGQLSA